MIDLTNPETVHLIATLGVVLAIGMWVVILATALHPTTHEPRARRARRLNRRSR